MFNERLDRFMVLELMFQQQRVKSSEVQLTGVFILSKTFYKCDFCDDQREETQWGLCPRLSACSQPSSQGRPEEVDE